MRFWRVSFGMLSLGIEYLLKGRMHQTTALKHADVSKRITILSESSKFGSICDTSNKVNVKSSYCITSQNKLLFINIETHEL